MDTRSNAEETARWLRGHRYRTVRLVTADWHLRRARMELEAAMEEPELRQRIATGGSLPRFIGREAFARFMAEESQRWRVVIQAVGASAD